MAVLQLVDMAYWWTGEQDAGSTAFGLACWCLCCAASAPKTLSAKQFGSFRRSVQRLTAPIRRLCAIVAIAPALLGHRSLMVEEQRRDAGLPPHASQHFDKLTFESRYGA